MEDSRFGMMIMSYLSILLTLTTITTCAGNESNDDLRKMTMIAFKKELNATEIIHEYLQEADILTTISDADHICKHILSSASSHHMISVDSMQTFTSSIDDCIHTENDINFEITKDKIVTYNDSLMIMHMTARKRRLLDDIAGTWIVGSAEFAQSQYNMASFIYDSTIFLLGGAFSSKNKQIITFDTSASTPSFTTSSTTLTASCEGESQFFTQISHNAYFAGATAISRYDLSTNELFANEISGINNTMDDLCLASTDSFIFVLGGSYDTGKGSIPALRKLQVYDLTAAEWLSNAPAMIRPRASLTCAVHPQTNMLYAIGGSNRLYPILDYEPIVEKIYIADITNNEWEQTQNNLYIGVRQARSVIYENYIVVIGGSCYYYPKSICPADVDTLQLIDVITEAVTYGPALGSGNKQFGVVYDENDKTIYVLGGFSKTTYRYLKIETNAPTNAPSLSPTMSPSLAPTAAPSLAPSQSPSLSPSGAPTDKPTDHPTSDPTRTPTKAPSIESNAPSEAPTANRTDAPSQAPITDQPTSAPLDQPISTPFDEPTSYAADVKYFIYSLAASMILICISF